MSIPHCHDETDFRAPATFDVDAPDTPIGLDDFELLYDPAGDDDPDTSTDESTSFPRIAPSPDNPPQTIDDLLDSIGCQYVPRATCPKCRKRLRYTIPWKPESGCQSAGPVSQWAECRECDIVVPIHRRDNGRIFINYDGARRKRGTSCPRCSRQFIFGIQIRGTSKFIKQCHGCGSHIKIVGNSRRFTVGRYRTEDDPVFRGRPSKRRRNPLRPDFDITRRVPAQKQRKRWTARAGDLCVKPSETYLIDEIWPQAA